LWTGALTAALALGALVTLGSPGTARAASSADNYNQMTGFGTTASAVTVPWTSGLRNAQNQPITTAGNELSPNSDRQAYAASPASATSPLSFMYNDFKNLSVTVSQTQDITHQGISVSWTGGVQTPNPYRTQGDFLQMMECYGDSSNGPSPEDCEYGSPQMLPTGMVNGSSIDGRFYEMCQTGSHPDAANPPAALDGDIAAGGCDPNEPGGGPGQPPAETPAHCDPAAATQGFGCPQGFFSIPFVPVNDPTNPLYGNSLSKDFNQFDSNEVQFASTNAAGKGDKEFDALTSVEAPWLGCGALEGNNQPRGCWLVIVPRGEYDANGFHPNVNNAGGGDSQSWVEGSPLSASDWAQRIQVHLSYAPLSTACPLDVQSRFVEGTQVITRAMSSWQFALNQAAKCSRLFTFTSTAETQTTTDLSTTGSQVGMGFTTIPIGSEAPRENLPPPTLPKILYAPVAVTALDFGFNVNLTNLGSLTPDNPIKLTPRLVAKAITQVYRYDLPDYVGNSNGKFPGPSWSAKNPETILGDSVFKSLNSAVATNAPALGHSLAPMLVGDRSADNQRVWQWIQSDAKTASWLDGTADPSDPVTADPDYVKFNPGKAPASDTFSQDYTGSITCGDIYGAECKINQNDDQTGLKLTSENLLPVADSFDTSASTTLSATDKSSPPTAFSSQNQAPDGTFGYWGTVGFEVTGSLFMWALSDAPDTASYGLVPADFCNPAGGNCVGLSTDSVTTALNSAKADSQGLLQVNPAKVPVNGYPLVDVVYAAVPTNQSGAALSDYADLIQYAASTGQHAGTAPGDLPPGYLPLPASLQKKAQAVAAQLRAVAHSPGHPGKQSGPGSNNPNSPGSGTTPGNGTVPGNGTAPGNGTTPGTGRSSTLGTSATSSSPSPSGPVIGSPSAELSSGVTPRSNLGKVRWALIAVLIIGAGGALGGGLLRYGGWPNWLNRPSWLPRTRT
jgi:hypothetical protein